MAGGIDAFLLAFGLPSDGESRLLRACLSDDPAARRASVESLLAEITAPEAGRRWMLPLLADRLDAEGRLDGPTGVKLRAAALHETGRSATFDAITADLAATINEAGCPVLLSRGHALALTAYARSGLRHRHDLDLLVPPERHAAAQAALGRAGLRLAGAEHSGAGAVLEHPSGLRVLLYGAPLPCADSRLDLDFLRRRATVLTIGKASLWMPDVTALLLHGLLLSAFRPPRGTAWVADAAVAIRGGAIDWNEVATVRGADAVDVLGRLLWLSEAIGIAVPEAPLSRLRDTVRALDRAERDAALARARRRGGMRAMLRASAGFGVRALLLRWGARRLLFSGSPGQAAPRGEKTEIGRQ